MAAFVSSIVIQTEEHILTRSLHSLFLYVHSPPSSWPNMHHHRTDALWLIRFRFNFDWANAINSYTITCSGHQHTATPSANRQHAFASVRAPHEFIWCAGHKSKCARASFDIEYATRMHSLFSVVGFFFCYLVVWLFGRISLAHKSWQRSSRMTPSYRSIRFVCMRAALFPVALALYIAHKRCTKTVNPEVEWTARENRQKITRRKPICYIDFCIALAREMGKIAVTLAKPEQYSES